MRAQAAALLVAANLLVAASLLAVPAAAKHHYAKPLFARASKEHRQRLQDLRGRRAASWLPTLRSTVPARSLLTNEPALAVARGGDDSEAAEFRKALWTTVAVVLASVLFGAGIWKIQGRDSALEFYTGYLVEQSLSVDNLFVFILLFDFFNVPVEFQPRALKWGIIGAIAMRGVMIGVGVAAIKRFRVVVLFFAGILMLSAWKLLMGGEGEEDLANNWVMKLAHRVCPAVDYFDGDRFLTMDKGTRRPTPLLLCVVCIELSDFVFAVDSIPAVLSISQDPFIVYSSNIFAILALRSLYTVVAKAVSDLIYLRPAVALILGFVGFKMLLEFCHREISTGLSLSVIGVLLAAGVGASLLYKPAPPPIAAKQGKRK